MEGISRKKSIWKLVAVVIYFRKLTNTFDQEHLEKLVVTFLILDFILLITRSTILKEQLKQKRNCLSKKANKKC